MPKHTNSTEILGSYLGAFDRLAARRAHEPAWLRATRRAALSAFERDGFPTTRDEAWRFTNIAPIAENLFARAPEPADPAAAVPADALVPGVAGPVLVFVNGRFAPACSSPSTPGAPVTTVSLAEGLSRDPALLEPHLARHAAFAQRPFVALNTALFEDGALIEIAPNAVVDQPIQVVFLVTDEAAPIVAYPRVLLLAGRNSHGVLVESFAGPAGARAFTSAVTEIVVGDGAVVGHYRVQREGDGAFHVGHTQVHLGRSASATSHAVALGARLSRHDTVAVLAGEGADCTLNGFYLVDGDRLVDHHTEIDHAVPHGTSHELYKGILDGRARAVFNGRIRVRPDAQKTDAKQTNKTLLLSDSAQVNTTPQLEIFANDVKCTHGATVGQLSDEALFYLRTRGIGADEARGLLVRAFAGDVTGRMALEPLRDRIDRSLAGWLSGRLREEVHA
jgi:Fe-S cluster assembly protein SufD